MRGIILWYNRNSKKIWKVVGILAIIVIIIQLLRWISIQKNKQYNNLITENEDKSNLNTITLEEDKSTITGQNLSKTQVDSLEVIDKFIEFCNNKQTIEAYNLLSDECKNEMYTTVDKFEEIYYEKIFNGIAKNTSVENWVGNIYKIKFTEDALSTGIYNPNNAIQDYITIIEDENDQLRLNINGYIGKEEINKSKEAFEIKVEVLERNQYMDFEIYKFKITNNSKNIILLNEIENTDTIYLQDQNGMKYYAYIHELSEADMRVLPGETKEITIKYYSKYISTKKIEKIVFSEIVLGGNEYAKFEI